MYKKEQPRTGSISLTSVSDQATSASTLRRQRSVFGAIGRLRQARLPWPSGFHTRLTGAPRRWSCPRPAHWASGVATAPPLQRPRCASNIFQQPSNLQQWPHCGQSTHLSPYRRAPRYLTGQHLSNHGPFQDQQTFPKKWVVIGVMTNNKGKTPQYTVCTWDGVCIIYR